MLGLLGLSRCELQQIAVGNAFLLQGLQLCVPIAVLGGATALEHPAPPLQAERPSVWRTGIIKMLTSKGQPF